MIDTPKELQGLNPEELRFYRLIEERTINTDGTQDITLACGHGSTQIIPLPDDLRYKVCAECIQRAAGGYGSSDTMLPLEQ